MSSTAMSVAEVAATDTDDSIGLIETGFESAGSIEIPEIFYRKFGTGIPAIDSIVGKDGFLPGGTFTITAKAGTGKTTLLLQILEALALQGKRVGYISGEEAVTQLAFTCKRLGVSHVKIANKTDVDSICKTMDYFDIIIVDSFQMVTTTKVKGSKKIEEYCIKRLIKYAKMTETTVGIVCHLTKAGKMKGSTNIAHLVDMNMEIWHGDLDLYMSEGARVIKVIKNRYGQTGSIVLDMGETGYDFINPLSMDELSEADVEENNSPTARKIAQYQTIKNLVNEKGDISLRDVTEALTIDVGKAKRLLGDLYELGDLDKIGRGKDAFWKAVAED